MSEDPDEGMLSWDESVFRDEHVFEIDYVPETFEHRETQMKSLQYALRPAVRGSRPLNAKVEGPPGTGRLPEARRRPYRRSPPPLPPRSPRRPARRRPPTHPESSTDRSR